MKRAFTLIELLVTILIASFAVALATYIWFEVTKQGLMTRAKTLGTEQAALVFHTLAEDALRIGSEGVIAGMAQSASSSGASSSSFAKTALWWNSPNDSSHFHVINNSNTDSLRFKTLTFGDSGQATGFELTRYFVNNNKQLVRTSIFYPNFVLASAVPKMTVLADSITTFNIRLGVIGSIGTSGDTLINISSSATILTPNSSSSNVKATLAGPFNLVAGATYEAQFSDSSSSGLYDYFDITEDELMVYIASSGSDPEMGLPVLKFYPTSTPLNRKWRFNSSTNLSSKSLMLSLKLKNTIAQPRIRLNNVRIIKISDATYSWTNTINTANKIATKSFEVEITATVRGKTSTLKRILPLPSNGSK
jgi:prepilin-type N-terminal cleavage/methylation domain-containing protein